MTQALALLMWAGTLPAIVLTVIVTVTVVFRVMVRADRYAEFKGFPPTPGAPGDLGPIPPVQAIWAGNYSVPSGRNSSARPTGICLSGGPDLDPAAYEAAPLP